MQVNNGVLDHMESLPSYWKVGPSDLQLLETKLSSWNRPTMNWSLECEQEGKTRQEGYQAATTDLKMAEGSL